jgi:two-component system, cell cycle response regulator
MEISSREICVLVADDSRISRKLLEYALAEDSYKVVFAKDGQEAIKLFTKRPADLVITDWEMADISGPDLCRKIRADFPAAYTYLLLLTSNSDKKSLAEGLAAGADDYLTKPFDQDELRARVGVGRRVIEMHREIEANNRRLTLEAQTDSLTGLPNRRAVEEWAVRQVAGAARHGYPVWVVLADLDLLKHVNDSLGHAAGDAMLQSFAEILSKNTRVSDLCGYFGGDQFILVLSHVEKDGIQLFINRLRERIAARPFAINGATIVLTASFGFACSEDCKPIELPVLLRQADAALLAAKSTAPRLTGVLGVS